MKPSVFFDRIKEQAKDEMHDHGILASLTMAQAALESGWGGSGLTVKANNLFGIKAGGYWKGATVIMQTKEWVGGKYITVNAPFRAYVNWDESIMDHTKLLMMDRYKNLIGEKDYKAACRKIREDGYATSPTYTQNLIRLIEQYKLYQYDKDAYIGYPVPARNLKWIKRVFIFRMHGSDVKWLQTALSMAGFPVKVDGDFAGETDGAVRAFQKKYKLDVDGVAGPNTRSKLIEILKL